jgi:hypothetical protein
MWSELKASLKREKFDAEILRTFTIDMKPTNPGLGEVVLKVHRLGWHDHFNSCAVGFEPGFPPKPKMNYMNDWVAVLRDDDARKIANLKDLSRLLKGSGLAMNEEIGAKIIGCIKQALEIEKIDA